MSFLLTPSREFSIISLVLSLNVVTPLSSIVSLGITGCWLGLVILRPFLKVKEIPPW